MDNLTESPQIKDANVKTSLSTDVIMLKFVQTAMEKAINGNYSVKWKVENRNSNDWIGVYKNTSADDDDYIAWTYSTSILGLSSSFRTSAMDNLTQMEARYFTYDVSTKQYIVIKRAVLNTNLKTKIFEGHRFAEDEFYQDKPSTGICFSGGGSRAMVLAMGQLRGIEQLGLMENVKYISSVSGGSWASTAYAYRLDNDTNDLIGEYESPQNLTMKNLQKILPGMAAVNEGFSFSSDGEMDRTDSKTLNFSQISPFTLNYLASLYNISKNNITQFQGWQSAVANSFLLPFDLLDKFSTDHYTLNEVTKQRFEKNNPLFKKQNNKIFTQNSNSPYLIVNGVITNFENEKNKQSKNYIGLEFTPLYGDTGYKENDFFVQFGKADVQIGNGAIQSQAFGGEPNGIINGGYINTIQPLSPLGLGAITGVSSNFLGGIISTEKETIIGIINIISKIVKAFGIDYFISILEKEEQFPLIKGLKAAINYIAKNADALVLQNPQTCYWSPNSTTDAIPKYATFDLADGGCMDNYGIMPMLRRQVKRIVVFINTDQPLSTAEVTDFKAVDRNFMDLNLPSLFGCLNDPTHDVGIDVSHNHVLEADGFKEVVLNLQKAKSNNQTVMTTTKHTTIQNDWWGVEPYDLEICWLYNDIVPNFEKELPNETQKALNLGRFRSEINPSNFPLYPTVDCTMNGFYRHDAAILGHIGAWNIASSNNKKAFEAILKA